MARVKRAVNAHKKRREVLEKASGYRGQRSRLYRKAKEQLLHSATYEYRDRKNMPKTVAVEDKHKKLLKDMDARGILISDLPLEDQPLLFEFTIGNFF